VSSIVRRTALVAAGLAGVAVFAAAGPASAAENQTEAPLTASGCTGGTLHQNVCINIEGTSVRVTSIYIDNNTGTAGTGTITVNGTTKWNFGTIPAHGHEGIEFQPYTSLSDGDQVCAHISGVSGVPCETIEK
jgi:uncharacterized membrane protein